MKLVLTQKVFESLELPEGSKEMFVFDESLPGFGIRLRTGGKCSYILQYREGSKQRLVTIGNNTNLTFDEARQTAKATLNKINQGLGVDIEKSGSSSQASDSSDAIVDFNAPRSVSSQIKNKSFVGSDRGGIRNGTVPSSSFRASKDSKETTESEDVVGESLNALGDKAQETIGTLYSWATNQIGEGDKKFLSELVSNPRSALGKLSDDIAIDLGTVNTIVHVMGKGIVIDEPSVVAVRTKPSGEREVLAVGHQAKQMLGRAPGTIETIRPMRDGVIADYVATEEMLRQFIGRTRSSFLGLRRPRILVCVPSGATPVERRAVYETAMQAGARRVYIAEEPVVAAIGAGLPVNDSGGTMVVDIGGGTTDIAVLSLGGVIKTRSLRIAGNAMDEAIVRHIRREHKMIISDLTAERIKIEIGSASRVVNGLTNEMEVRGRDPREARTKTVSVFPQQVAEALQSTVEALAEFIGDTLGELPMEVASDINDRGVLISGGGALLRKLDRELELRLGVPVRVSENPLHCVVRGAALLLQNLDQHEHLLISP